MPSSFASFLAISKDSSVEVVTIPCKIDKSKALGTNPSPMPSIPWEPHSLLLRRGHSEGSTAKISIFSFFSFKNLPMPLIHPPVP